MPCLAMDGKESLFLRPDRPHALPVGRPLLGDCVIRNIPAFNRALIFEHFKAIELESFLSLHLSLSGLTTAYVSDVRNSN